MNKKVFKSVVTIIIISAITIVSLSINSKVYAGFADFDDATADAETNKELKEQKEHSNEVAGKSADNTLSELSVAGYKISPDFNKDVVNYSINEDVTASTLTIDAKTTDSNAKVSGIGTVNLKTGVNSLRIDVAAENGTVKTYFIGVEKKEVKNVDLSLESLELITDDSMAQSLELSHDFDKNLFSYTCSVDNSVSSINVLAVPNNTENNVEITGNDNLHDGVNDIVIKVKTPNKKEEETYIVKVTKKAKEPEVVDNNPNNLSNETILRYCEIFVGVIALIILIIVLVRKGKHNRSSRH